MWLIPPPTVCRSVPAPADSTSGLSLALAERFARSATLSGKLAPPKSWQRAWQRRPWLRRLCGRTCEPSTLDAGVESWIASLRESPARATACPESASSTSTRAISGRTLGECFGTWVPDVGSSSSKTSTGSWCQTGLLGTEPLSLGFSESWPPTGGMRNGSCWRRPTLALRTGGGGCSSWPTVRCEDAESCGNHTGAMDSLHMAVRLWPTASANDHKCATRVTQRRKKALDGAAEHWSLPNVPTRGPETRGFSLLVHPSSASGSTCLPTRGPILHPLSRLIFEVYRLNLRRRLNPRFVEWLMGLPVGWSDSRPLGTEWFHYKQLLRSEFSRIVSGTEHE